MREEQPRAVGRRRTEGAGGSGRVRERERNRRQRQALVAARERKRNWWQRAARAGERGRTGGGVRERLREDAGDGLRVHCGVLGL